MTIFSSLLNAEPDLHALPLRDGQVTLESPKADTIFLCRALPGDRGGAQRRGEWIKRDGTFDSAAKPTVPGQITWPNHQLTVSLQQAQRIIESNGLPNIPTGIFPTPSDSVAYRYDRNPNSIRENRIHWTLPSQPQLAREAGCLPMGPIGLLLDGVKLYSALDGPGRDAIAHEIQDACWGHPDRGGNYHHHSLTPCLELGDAQHDSPLIGYALDGFGIYGPYQAGNYITNTDLDECHGMTSRVMWDGQMVEMYHYVANYEYPYTLGCFRGKANKPSLRVF